MTLPHPTGKEGPRTTAKLMRQATDVLDTTQKAYQAQPTAATRAAYNQAFSVYMAWTQYKMMRWLDSSLRRA